MPPNARERSKILDRNLVVTAGAGTGKTTLLVDRLVHLLLHNPDPLEITEIVALTFTNKAADEMKLRLRERLQAYLDVSLGQHCGTAAEEKNQSSVHHLLALYRLSKEEMDSRLQTALINLERGNIGTINSFAAAILRLYPLEAAIDPRFQEDDGTQYDRLFDEQWDIWLGEQLALASTRAAEWRRVLVRFQLGQIKELARSVASEIVELKRSPESAIPAAVAEWLSTLEQQAATLVASHPEDRNNEKLARAALATLRGFSETGQGSDTPAADDDVLANKEINRSIKGWPHSDIVALQEVVRAAKGMTCLDQDLAQVIWSLISDFALRFASISSAQATFPSTGSSSGHGISSAATFVCALN